MKNHVSEGVNIGLDSSPYEVDSGDYVLDGLLGGVAASDADSNGEVVIVTEGIFDLASHAGSVFNVGDAVFFNPTDKLMHANADGQGDSNSGGTVQVATCVRAKGAGETTVRAKLIPPVAA
jgi:predicted RecA/RadA family phage recombinase